MQYRKLKIEQQKPNKIGVELSSPLRVSSTCYTSGARRDIFVKHPTIGDKRGKKDVIVFTTNGTYSWSSVRQIFCSV